MIFQGTYVFGLRILKFIWVIVKTWWWLILPLLLWKPFLFFYLQWRRERWAKKQKYILLEIKMSREVTRPFKAMEQVFSSWWMLYDPADWWEKWIEGKFQLSMFVEIVSIGGTIHFYVYIPKSIQNLVESSLYAQYPEVEVSIVKEKYTDLVPQDIPNSQWDIWGCDYEMTKPDVYPIKTYSRFFEEKPEIKAEKRVDPLAQLLEGMSKLRPGEAAWVQLKLTPITNADNDFKDRAKRIVDKLLKRPEKNSKPTPILKEASDLLLFGKMPGEKEKQKQESVIPPEMELSPGEREVVSAIENKVSKPMFQCWIRFIIMGKRDIFNKANLKNILGFFANFNTENLNGLKPWGKSITKIKRYEHGFLNILFYDSLLYVRKRRIFKKYIQRLPLFYPHPGKQFVLNIEELATIFHCIGREAVPAPEIQRIESKKSEPPPNLPI